MKRFILSMALPIGAFVLLIVLTFLGLAAYRSEMQKQASYLIQILNGYAGEAKQRGEDIASQAMISHLSALADCRVCLYTEEGNLLFDSDRSGAKVPDPYSAVNIVKASEGIISTSLSGQGRQYTLNEFSALQINGNSYILCTSLPLHEYAGLLLIQRAIILTGAGLLVVIVVLYLLRQRALKYKAISTTETHQNLQDQLRQIELYANERISLLSTVLTNMDSGIILFGTDGSVLLINPKAQSLTGAKSSLFFPDRSSPESDYPPVLSAIQEMARSSMDTKKPVKQDVHTDDGRILSVRTSVVYSKYIPYTFYGTQAFISDVTEKRRMEKIKDEFVSNVSHELRTPLTLISGFTETLQNWRELDDKDCERALEIIDIESKRLKHMISQLLDLSHIESRIGVSPRNPINAIEAIQSVCSAIEILAEEHKIEFTTEFPKERVVILAEKISISQIVTNLCENAIKYTQTGGTVLLAAQKGMRHLTILVRDNGIGIPEEEIPNIFERFYRVEKSRNTKHGGSGLGLSITKGLVDELGGTISVKSRPHVGSTFIVRLPLFRERQPGEKSDAAG